MRIEVGIAAYLSPSIYLEAHPKAGATLITAYQQLFN